MGPGGRGAKIQQTVTALNNLGIMVFGMGGQDGAAATVGAAPEADPRKYLEALATLTGAINSSTQTIDSGITAGYFQPLHHALAILGSRTIARS